jgi:hypothetical protein
MLYIIRIQKGKDIGEIMHELESDKNKKIKYRRNEKITGVIFILICVLRLGIEMLQLFPIVFKESSSYFTTEITIERGFLIFEIAWMILIFAVLIQQLKTHHYFEYRLHRANFTVFFILALCLLVLQVIRTWVIPRIQYSLLLNQNMKTANRIFYIFYYLGFWHLLVSMIVLQLKPTDDVIGGISKLEYTVSVSIY